MRSISVSTGVYAQIWAQRQDGEETEDDILRRLLGAGPRDEKSPVAPGRGGVIDGRSGVHFPEGFKVFRRYKGRDYAASARSGQWVRDDNGSVYPTLNQLNSSIVSGAENVWNGNWKYQDDQGATQPISRLRRE